MLYIVGKWDSVAAHHDFLPSASNQKLLDTLKEDIAMSGTDERQMEMWHLDNDVFSLGNSQGDRSVFTAPARSCNRHFVPVEKKAGSGGNLGNSGGSWRSIQSPTRLWVNGGLRKRMWVEIWVRNGPYSAGCEGVDQHMAFAQTDGFAKYRETVEFVEGFEAKHLRTIEAFTKGDSYLEFLKVFEASFYSFLMLAM
jgi:hypothetical protein